MVVLHIYCGLARQVLIVGVRGLIISLAAMFPNSQDEGPGLEDRLRGLILNNATPTTPSTPPGPVLPPHMITANSSEQQQYLAKAASQTPAKEPMKSPNPGQQPGRKRLNQAQRRQMNAEFSIPIDPRQNPLLSGNTTASFTPGQAHAQGNAFQRNSNTGLPQHLSQYQTTSPRFSQSPQMHSPHQPWQQDSRQRFPPSNQYQNQNQNPYAPRSNTQNRQLYQPGPSNAGRRGTFVHNAEDAVMQSTYLEALVQEYIPQVQVEGTEKAQKEAFRATVEQACRECITQYETQERGNEKIDGRSVELCCFGSTASGFATKGSDMDLALLSPQSVPSPDSPESPIPRLLEKTLLDCGLGARLLTKTRVPIIKLCEKPTSKLHRDLVAERMKWEKGFAEDEKEADEAEVDDVLREDGLEVVDEMPKENPGEFVDVTKTKSNRRSKYRKSSTAEDHRGPLRQSEKQSLMQYYDSAKRRLRKLSGGDLSATQELTEEESKTLNQVCKEFIDGLLSTELSKRLRNYQSISPLYDAGKPFVQRSLNGIWTQIEGEHLALAWDERPLPESNDRAEDACYELVKAWRILQQQTGPLMESNLYNKQLYLAAERLKRISSLQLMFLEQFPQEDAVQYLTRTQRLMSDLRQSDETSIMPIFVAQYIKGIYNFSIREELQGSYRNKDTLKWVGFQHRVLQLAGDYEHALLRTDLYEDSEKPIIEDYIGLLHSLFHHDPISLPPQRPDLTNVSLIAKIRHLPDPTTVSPNRPRDRFKDHLNFPPNIGIQCDINFSAHLALHNTTLLRCYSHTDPRVRPLVLFIKHWAKTRCINTPYRGTLSSYGYVLMVLHYLVNIANPFVCPNLQQIRREPPHYLPPAEIEAMSTCQGRDVRFWRNEAEIKNLCERGQLNFNCESIGGLVRGFFEYYAQPGPVENTGKRGFDWGREVLSLRTPYGILTKQEKGWVGARTVVETTTTAPPPTPSLPVHTPTSATTPSTTLEDGQMTPAATGDDPTHSKKQIKTIEETKEVRHRYLFAIEDPFELDHNVARTVTHNGIVRIREELRRGWRIIKAVGKGPTGEGLMDAYVEVEGRDGGGWREMLGLMHGDVGLEGMDGEGRGM